MNPDSTALALGIYLNKQSMLGPSFSGYICILSADGPHITASKLKAGGKYLHKNLGWYRKIDIIVDDKVFYSDFAGSGFCTKAHFAHTCPTEAIEEEIEYLDKKKYPSFT